MSTRENFGIPSLYKSEDNIKEKFIHVYHVDLDRMISDNESERDRLVRKLQFYNAVARSPSWVLPVKETNVRDMPVLGRGRVNEYTPARRLDKDWVYMSTWELEEIEIYGDELDGLNDFIDFQFAGANRELISYLDTPPLVHQDTPLLVDSHTEVSADAEPVGPVCEQADEDIIRVEHETGRLYQVTELAQSTSLSEPVDVNRTKEAQCVVNSTTTDIISKGQEVRQATPKGGGGGGDSLGCPHDVTVPAVSGTPGLVHGGPGIESVRRWRPLYLCRGKIETS